MALQKTELNKGGVKVDYWRASAVKSFDPDLNMAVIQVKGYLNAGARQAGEGEFKIHEFLVFNSKRTEQVTRQATLEEKKIELDPRIIEGLTDEEINAIGHDIVESEKIIPLPYFDDFSALYVQGKWQQACYAYLKSGADMLNGFFINASDV